MTSYNIARRVFLHGIGLVYFVAFLVSYDQNDLLIGSRGLTPAASHLNRIKVALNSEDILTLFNRFPTLFWFLSTPEEIDKGIEVVSICGMITSLIPMLSGKANMIVIFSLYAMYISISNVGSVWYSFGFEAQLLETSFSAISLVPLFSLSSDSFPTPLTGVWIYRWLIIRIYLGAGLIKFRGSECWRDLSNSCMNYHYETTCIPNPFSWYMHQLPREFHALEALFNHVVQICLPWLLLLPRELRHIGGFGVMSEMFLIQATGNYGFLNMLTMLPAIFCFDDDAFRFVLSLVLSSSTRRKKGKRKVEKSAARSIFDAGFLSMIVVLSVPVVSNLISSRQVMNTSFNQFQIVNTYGAFGHVQTERHEVIMFGSNDDGKTWREYDFKCKPGLLAKRPCVLAPYHNRIDWLLWFAGFQSYQQHPWLVHLVHKILKGDSRMKRFLSFDPFEETGEAPKLIKIDRYKYQYTRNRNDINWWRREFKESFLPPVSLTDSSVEKFLRHHYEIEA